MKSWKARTWAVVPNTKSNWGFVNWCVLDDGQAWGVAAFHDDPWYYNEMETARLLKLDPDNVLVVSADDQVWPDWPNQSGDVDDYPDGSLYEVPLDRGYNFLGLVDDGRYMYYYENNFMRLRRIDPVAMTVETLIPNYDFSRFHDSHDSSNARIGRMGGDLHVDRENRYLYWWDRLAGSNVAYLRRMGLDGSRPVVTLGGPYSDISLGDSEHSPTSLQVRNGRIWFPTHTFGANVLGFWGIGSMAIDGTDFRAHYIDPRSNAATDRCGFTARRQPMIVVGDELIVACNAGTSWVMSASPYEARVLSFDITRFEADLTKTWIHDRSDPIFQVIAGQEAGVSTDYYFRDGTNSLLGTTHETYFRQSYAPGWEGKILFVSMSYIPEVWSSGYKVYAYRILEKADDVWDVTVLFSGNAFKGYDPIYPQQRSGPLEFELS